MNQTIVFTFHQGKATQAAALLLEREGGEMSAVKLMQLLYLVDREALGVRCSPVCGGHYCLMKNGPMIYEVIEIAKHVYQNYEWNSRIQINGSSVNLVKEALTDELSRRDIRIIDGISEKFRELTGLEVHNWCRATCDELKASVNKTIDVTEIFNAHGLKLTEADIEAIFRESWVSVVE